MCCVCVRRMKNNNKTDQISKPFPFDWLTTTERTHDQQELKRKHTHTHARVCFGFVSVNRMTKKHFASLNRKSNDHAIASIKGGSRSWRWTNRIDLHLGNIRVINTNMSAIILHYTTSKKHISRLSRWWEGDEGKTVDRNKMSRRSKRCRWKRISFFFQFIWFICFSLIFVYFFRLYFNFSVCKKKKMFNLKKKITTCN